MSDDPHTALTSAALAACDAAKAAMVPGSRYELVFPAMEQAMRATLLAMRSGDEIRKQSLAELQAEMEAPNA